jgi:elongation factor 1-gamma
MALKFFPETEWKKYRNWKIQVAAEIAGVDLDVADPASAELKKYSPSGKSVLVTPHGPVFENTAILRYLARVHPDAGLYGSSVYQAALVDQWVDFGSLELEPVRHIWLLPTKGHIKFDGKAYSEAKKELTDALTILNEHLLHHTFLVGHQVTIADIAIAAALVEPYTDLFEPSIRNGFTNVTRWFNTVVNQKAFQNVVPKVELAKQEKRAGKGGDQKQDQQKGQQQQQQQQKGQQQQQKGQQQQQKPKQEKPAEKKDEPLPDDLGEEPKPKGKNPLDLLPASSMNLDALKKVLFSQRPWNPDFFKEFWPNFDAQGYSIWFQNYNYNSENRVYFMTCNLMGGFLQRCDEIRKYALGVVLLAGNNEDAPPFEVSGVWVFRGNEIPQGMKDNPDSEYYTFTKLDHNKKEDRAKVESWFFADSVQSQSGKLNVLERRFFK